MSRVLTTQHSGLKLTEPDDSHWKLGSGKASERFGATPLNPAGDYTAYIPAFEAQSRPGFDTQGCALFGTLKAYVTLGRFLGFRDFLPDASERYTGVWAGTSEEGTDPHVVAETIRSAYGMVPQAVMPWTDQATLPDYYDREQATANLPLGKSLLRRFQFGHEWVFVPGSRYSPEEKQQLLRRALTRGTVCVSISGYYRFTQEGRLMKPIGERDTHWVMLNRFQGANGVIDDQYAPFVKTIAENYDHDAAKVYFMQRSVDRAPDFWSRIWATFAQLWGRS